MTDTPPQRDLFPLQRGTVLLDILRGYVVAPSGSQRRRYRRMTRAWRWLDDGIGSLHEMSGAPSSVVAAAKPSLCQSLVIRQMEKHYLTVAANTRIVNAKEAFNELLKTKSRYGAVATGVGGLPTSFKPATMKLPRFGAGKVSLVDLLPQPYSHMLETGHGILRTSDDPIVPERRAAFDAVF